MLQEFLKKCESQQCEKDTCSIQQKGRCIWSKNCCLSSPDHTYPCASHCSLDGYRKAAAQGSLGSVNAMICAVPLWSDVQISLQQAKLPRHWKAMKPNEIHWNTMKYCQRMSDASCTKGPVLSNSHSSNLSGRIVEMGHISHILFYVCMYVCMCVYIYIHTDNIEVWATLSD